MGEGKQPSSAMKKKKTEASDKVQLPGYSSSQPTGINMADRTSGQARDGQLEIPGPSGDTDPLGPFCVREHFHITAHIKYIF